MKFKVAYLIRQWWKFWEQYPQRNLAFSVLWLALISGIAFLWQLGNTGLVDETEPLFAEASRQMVETGNWVTPYFNGETRFDKPPLVYWMMAIGYQLIGVNEWAVRLPSAIAAIALMILGFYTLRSLGFVSPATAKNPTNPQSQRQVWISAWIGSALIALNPHTLVWSHVGVSDMLLSGCLGMSLFAFFLGYAKETQEGKANTSFQVLPSNGWYWAFYILLGLAVLTKGPVGVVLPGIIIGAFLLYVGKFWEVVKEMGIVGGGILFLLITVPWYVLVILENGEAYINSFFGYHNVERFTSVVNGHSAPWYFYFPAVLIGFAPWSIYLPIAIAKTRCWQRNFWTRQPRQSQLGLFAFFWFACIFLFFTVAVTKLPSYVLPLIPACAILVALFWSEELTTASSNPDRAKKDKGLLISGILNVIFLAILAGAIAYSPNFIGYDPAAPNLDQLFAQSNLNISGAFIWGIATVGAALLLIKPATRPWLWSPNLIAFLAFILFVLTPAQFLIDQARQQPLRELAVTAVTVEKPQEELLMIGFKKPSIVFYSQRPVEFFTHTKFAQKYLEDAIASSSTPPSFLVIAAPKDIDKFNFRNGEESEIIAQEGAYQLVRIVPES
ncbi:MAG: ArnT family glycosyltransferase [Chroococcales cyanobacterium]